MARRRSALLDQIDTLAEDLPYIDPPRTPVVYQGLQPGPKPLPPQDWAVARACAHSGVVRDPRLVTKFLLRSLELKYPDKARQVNRRAGQILGIEPLLNKTVSFTGPAGSGKSLSAVAIAYGMRELFGKRIVEVSQSSLLPAFGEYIHLSRAQFFSNLIKKNFVASIVIKEHLDPESAEVLYASEKVVIRNSVLLLDEAYDLMDAKDAGDKAVKLYSNFMMNYRHDGCTVLLMAPQREVVTKRVRFQVNWTGSCRYDERTEVAVVEFHTRGGRGYKYVVYGPDYFGMYKTLSEVTTRQKYLNIAWDEV